MTKNGDLKRRGKIIEIDLRHDMRCGGLSIGCLATIGADRDEVGDGKDSEMRANAGNVPTGYLSGNG